MLDLTLTPEQRETLNAAEATLRGVLRSGALWMFSMAARSEPGAGTYCTATYFDSNKTQHGDLWAPDCTFADKVQMGLNYERNLPSAEEAKAMHVAELQAQLARLTGEAA